MELVVKMENIEVHTDLKQGEIKIGSFYFSLTEEEFKQMMDLLLNFSEGLKTGTVGIKDINGNYNKNFTIPEELF